MLNSGALFKKPYESGYGRFCRFLAVNTGTSTSVYYLENEFKVAGIKFLDKQDSRTFPRALMASKLQFLKDDYSPDEIENTDILERGYRPVLQCPECAKINFHSYLYDKPWITICPVHLKRLKNRCPGCDQPWLPGSELSSRKCVTCSTNTPFLEWVKNDDVSSDVFRRNLSAHEELQKQLDSEIFPVFRAIVFDESLDPRSLNSENELLKIAALKHFDLLTPTIEEYFASDINSLPDIVMAHFSSLETLNRSSQGLSFGRLYRGYDFQVLMHSVKASFQTLIGDTHELETCRDSRTQCIACATWESWKQIVSYPFKLNLAYDLKDWLSEFINMRNFGQASLEPGLISDVIDFDGDYVALPGELILKLNTQNCLRSLVNIYQHLAFQRALSLKTSNPNCEQYLNTLREINTFSADYPDYAAIEVDASIHLLWYKLTIPSVVKRLVESF